MAQQCRVVSGIDNQLLWAMDLRERYGLYHLTIKQVLRKWRRHSDNYAACWMARTIDSVESVFGVKLEAWN